MRGHRSRQGRCPSVNPPYDETAIHHGRLYPTLDTLVDKGLVENGEKDQRRNADALTRCGQREIKDRREWEDEYVDEAIPAYALGKHNVGGEPFGEFRFVVSVSAATQHTAFIGSTDGSTGLEQSWLSSPTIYLTRASSVRRSLGCASRSGFDPG